MGQLIGVFWCHKLTCSDLGWVYGSVSRRIFSYEWDCKCNWALRRPLGHTPDQWKLLSHSYPPTQCAIMSHFMFFKPGHAEQNPNGDCMRPGLGKCRYIWFLFTLSKERFHHTVGKESKSDYSLFNERRGEGQATSWVWTPNLFFHTLSFFYIPTVDSDTDSVFVLLPRYGLRHNTSTVFSTWACPLRWHIILSLQMKPRSYCTKHKHCQHKYQYNTMKKT